MVLLTLGVLLWALTHLFPSFMPAARSSLIEKIGEGPYKGLFTLDLVVAILLMVFGWQSVDVEFWYVPLLVGSPRLVALLVLVAFILLGAGNAPTNIKRFVRHPMLTGIIVWSVAHLLANGENRSVVLFAGLGLWALIAIFAISRRDGEWLKPDAVPLAKDAVLGAIGVVIFAVFAYFHEFLFGVAPLAGI